MVEKNSGGGRQLVRPPSFAFEGDRGRALRSFDAEWVRLQEACDSSVHRAFDRIKDSWYDGLEFPPRFREVIRLKDATEFTLHMMERAGMLLSTATDDPAYHVLCGDPRKDPHPSVIELGPGIFEAVLASGKVRPVDVGDGGQWFEYDGLGASTGGS